jgi:hypothetical protein
MTPDSKTMDAAEKLMLDLMEKHPARVGILAASAIPKRRKGKTRGIASNRWQFYEAQLGPIARAAAWLRLNVCLWHFSDIPPAPTSVRCWG